jgi:hypothetical protein
LITHQLHGNSTTTAVCYGRLVAYESKLLLRLALWFAGSLAQAQTNPVPFLNQPLAPTSTAPGGPGITLTVNGTGFASTSVVDWNGSALQTGFVSDSQLTATVPAAAIANPSTATISVVTPGPTGARLMSNSSLFPR